MIEGLAIEPGVEVIVSERRYKITQVLDLERVLVRDMATGEAQQFRLIELRPAPPVGALPPGTAVDSDSQQVNEARWQLAQARFAIIRPLLEQADYRRADVKARAQATGYGAATVYRWLRQYQRAGVVSALVPHSRGAARGQHRLPPEVNVIVDATLQDTYLTDTASPRSDAPRWRSGDSVAMRS